MSVVGKNDAKYMQFLRGLGARALPLLATVMLTSISSLRSTSLSTDATSRIIHEVAERVGVTLKEKQLGALTSFSGGNDTFVTLPTGYGKSIIYSLLPLIFDKLYIQFSYLYCDLIVNCPGQAGSIVSASF